jgi:hypothetical protein
MSESMIERATKAVLASFPPDRQMPEAEARTVAMNVMASMREPTSDMIDARFNALGQGGKAEWEAMIDAALSLSECPKTP